MREKTDMRMGCIIWLIVVIIAILAFCSCTTQKQMVTEQVYVHDTIATIDSIMLRDTVTQVRTEQVITEKNVFREVKSDYKRGSYDMVRQAVIDTVYYSVYESSVNDRSNFVKDSITIKNLREELKSVIERYDKLEKGKSKEIIEKPYPWYAKPLMYMGVILLIEIIIGIVYIVFF
ncbi:MAG: hypothetical protein HUK08_00375 [Bacteroidaceae bacterium]|nr:hypothetical protein [Bacteroidaceae bacterium]